MEPVEVRSQKMENVVKTILSTVAEREELLEELVSANHPPMEHYDINCDPYHHIMRMVFSKWKPFIIRAIYLDTSTNFSRFFKQLPVSQKVLSQNLRELQSDGLVLRNVTADQPPRVEYTLTEQGESIIPLLDLLYDWAWIDMKRKNLPVDSLGEMWHGYRPPRWDVMDMPYK